MRRAVYIVADSIVSPLAYGTAANMEKIVADQSGIALHKANSFSPQDFYAALFSDAQISLTNGNGYTKFEQSVISSIENLFALSARPSKNAKTVFILSTTKGNISLLEQAGEHDPEKLSLFETACRIATNVGLTNEPIVISHACISGVLAILTASRLISSGMYDHAIVAGGDLITRFVLSGFQSFQAVSSEPCRPFDAKRNGVTLGEGAAAIMLSAEKPGNNAVAIGGGCITNDANHISGPSRTGEELAHAIKQSMHEAKIAAENIGFISAHGTATIYNDEMEAKAIHHAGLQDSWVNSLKGFYGHTLGAAGLIESIISAQALKNQFILPTRGYDNPGTTMPVKVSKELQRGSFTHCLKTASGFGGCNAAMIMELAN